MTPPAPGAGWFLAFEGVEGSGKSTQVTRLGAAFRDLGLDVVVAREPGSTPLGEQLREIALAQSAVISPASELFLMLAARAAFVTQVLRPGLDRGAIVIADRFELSTLAYQGYGRGLDLREIRRANHIATGGITPDLTVFIEIEPETGAERQRAAGKLRDRIEREDPGFHRRVNRGYREVAGDVHALLKVRGDAPAAAVHEEIVAALRARFPELFIAPRVMMSRIPRRGAEAFSNPDPEVE